MKVDFAGYKVTRLFDSKSIKIDGTVYLTNESGKTWYELFYMFEPSVVYTANGSDLKITFDGGNTAIHNISRRYTYTYLKNVVTGRVEGIGSYDGRSNVESWGQTRDGNYFTSQVVSPVIWKSSCGTDVPLAGEVLVKVDVKEFELKCLYGTDKDGKQVITDTECPYGWKMSWSYKRKSNSRVFAYR